MTNREAHEEAAGMNLSTEFFTFNGIDPDAEYEEIQIMGVQIMGRSNETLNK